MPTPKKILIVDDEVNFTKMVDAFFEDSGHKIHIANSGIEALRLLREFYFDLVLLDLKMPDFDGIHVARTIRETRPSAKIIVITGYKEQYENELSPFKVDFVLQKPIGMNDLMEKVTSLLGPTPAPQPKRPSKTGIPKAKLLFIEYDDILYSNLFLPYFKGKETKKEAFYELMLADDKDKAVSLARIFRPDVILLNTNVIEMYPEIQKELQEIVALPKEIIIHGRELYAKSPNELGLDPNKITAVEGGVFDMDYPRRLEEAVREIASRHGLVDSPKSNTR